MDHDKHPHGRRLRIAQIAPLYESIPPKLYGGTERVVAHLCEGLAQRGHDVSLFAAGGSTVRVRLKPGCATSLRLSGLHREGPAYHLPMLSEVYEHAAEFDLIHSHVDYWDFPLRRLCSVPSISTLHGRLDMPRLKTVYRHFSDLPVVSISNSQREPLREMKWMGTAYHGLPDNSLPYDSQPDNYLAFLGRFSPEKRADLAIEIAQRAGIPLKIAAKVDEANQEYFKSVIEPLLRRPGVEYLGEIHGRAKAAFLGKARALLFPIDWPEPFGLVMIEAMACGTPVIARPYGSVPEIIRDGVNGRIEDKVDELVRAARRIDEISRAGCRRDFENRFTLDCMVSRYENMYWKVLDNSEDEPRGNKAQSVSDCLGSIAD